MASQNQDQLAGGTGMPATGLASASPVASLPSPPGKKPPSSGQGISRRAQPGQDAASRYRELTGLHPNRLQRELLIGQVCDLERWDATLEHWLGHGWSPRNIIGLLELYQRGGPGGCLHCKKRTPLDCTLETLEQMRKELAFGDPG